MAFRLHRSKAFRLCLPLAIALYLCVPAEAATSRSRMANAVDFNRDIRPILSENCYACHGPDRKSTRLNSSHSQISYAVFCLKKKKQIPHPVDITHIIDLYVPS